jgi:hypothetical protein
MILIDADNDWYLTNSSKLTYSLLWFPKKKFSVFGFRPNPLKRGRKERGRERGMKRRTGKGKRWEGRDGERTGMGREEKEGRRKETGTTSFRTLPPPLSVHHHLPAR